MEGIEYIYELCEKLPRSGPGNNELTRRAYNAIPGPLVRPRILDLGCGQGMQTIELAKLSRGNIIALDNHQGFLDILNSQAKLQAVDRYITTENVSMLEMQYEDNSFDIIWAEGALYNMGFVNGLNKCHALLKDDGYLAVTELVYTVAEPPAEVVEYIACEYPDIKTVPENIEMIEQSGYKVLTHFNLPESAWLDNYYTPMEQELPSLISQHADNASAQAIFRGFADEISHYRKYSQYYGYAFFVMHKLSL